MGPRRVNLGDRRTRPAGVRAPRPPHGGTSMTSIAQLPAPPLADTPLGRTIATTDTDIWNDSCAIEELRYAISFGAVGATANPTIVMDSWKHEPAVWQRRV